MDGHGMESGNTECLDRFRVEPTDATYLDGLEVGNGCHKLT